MDVYQIYYMDSNNNKRIVSGGKSKEIAMWALKGTNHEGKDIQWKPPIYGYLGMNTMHEGEIQE